MAEPDKKLKIEAPDILLILGLVLLFVGLGFAITWPIAMMVTGAVLIGLTVWMVEPPKISKDKS